MMELKTSQLKTIQNKLWAYLEMLEAQPQFKIAASLDSIEKMVDDLGFFLKYNLFDLEATRMELKEALDKGKTNG